MKKIIHVDNSDFFRKQMRTFLEAEGFEVESHEKAQEANFAIVGGTADMVIMGMTFEDIEGEQFLLQTRENFTGPVAVVSSSMDAEMAKKLIDIGAIAALNKSGHWKEGLMSHLAALKK